MNSQALIESTKQHIQPANEHRKSASFSGFDHRLLTDHHKAKILLASQAHRDEKKSPLSSIHNSQNNHNHNKPSSGYKTPHQWVSVTVANGLMNVSPHQSVLTNMREF